MFGQPLLCIAIAMLGPMNVPPHSSQQLGHLRRLSGVLRDEPRTHMQSAGVLVEMGTSGERDLLATVSAASPRAPAVVLGEG